MLQRMGFGRGGQMGESVWEGRGRIWVKKLPPSVNRASSFGSGTALGSPMRRQRWRCTQCSVGQEGHFSVEMGWRHSTGSRVTVLELNTSDDPVYIGSPRLGSWVSGVRRGKQEWVLTFLFPSIVFFLCFSCLNRRFARKKLKINKAWNDNQCWFKLKQE